MDIESQIIDALYQKLGGFSLSGDACLPTGEVIAGGRIKKYQIKRAIQLGGASTLIDLLIADPARLGNYGTKSIRDGLSALVANPPKDGRTLAETVSQIIRQNEIKQPGA